MPTEIALSTRTSPTLTIETLKEWAADPAERPRFNFATISTEVAVPANTDFIVIKTQRGE